mgnify:CR=1 FL=1
MSNFKLSENFVSKYKRKKEAENDASSDSEEIYEVVFVYDNGKARLRVVETGIQDDRNIEITDGIELDEEIIIGSYTVVSKKLFDNTEVEKEEKDKSKEED